MNFVNYLGPDPNGGCWADVGLEHPNANIWIDGDVPPGKIFANIY